MSTALASYFCCTLKQLYRKKHRTETTVQFIQLAIQLKQNLELMLQHITSTSLYNTIVLYFSENRKSHLLVTVKVIFTHDTDNLYVFFLNSNHASLILKQSLQKVSDEEIRLLQLCRTLPWTLIYFVQGRSMFQVHYSLK